MNFRIVVSLWGRVYLSFIYVFRTILLETFITCGCWRCLLPLPSTSSCFSIRYVHRTVAFNVAFWKAFRFCRLCSTVKKNCQPNRVNTFFRLILQRSNSDSWCVCMKYTNSYFLSSVLWQMQQSENICASVAPFHSTVTQPTPIFTDNLG